jgi:RNA 2',3'-cyclic 3'-phosphodiesterase
MSAPCAPEKCRLFIAISVPETIKAEMVTLQREFRRRLPEADLRWTRAEQIHLTLRFLGNIRSERVDALANAMSVGCRPFPVLALRAETIGFFPSARSPRVVWVGVQDSAGELGQLQAAVQAATTEFTSEEPEPRFTGHLTLARAKRIGRNEAAILEVLAKAHAGRLFGEWTASTVELVRSELSSEGARYTTLLEAPLIGH